jgi:predicted membrane-bound mannosyltransferase
MPDSLKECLPQHRWEWLLLAGALGVACLLRLQGMGDPLSHDEVYTWEVFASQPYGTIVTHYPVPNNHIFHSLLVRLSSELFGQSEWTIRLPALLAGLLSVPALFVLGTALFHDRKAGLVAAWLLTLGPVHIYYSHSARGYTLLVLLSILAWFCLCRGLRGGASWWFGYVSAGFLAAYTIPSGILYLFSLAVWSVAMSIRQRAWRETKVLLGINALVVLLAGLAYWPVREQLVGAGEQWGVAMDGTTGQSVAALLGVIKGSRSREIGQDVSNRSDGAGCPVKWACTAR